MPLLDSLDGTNRIRYNVIGWRYNNILTVQIHDTEDGSYEERKCSIDSKGIITEIQSSTTFNENSNYPLLYSKNLIDKYSLLKSK